MEEAFSLISKDYIYCFSQKITENLRRDIRRGRKTFFEQFQGLDEVNQVKKTMEFIEKELKNVIQ